MSQWHCCEHGTFDPREGCAECKSGADELHRLNTDVATLTSELVEARAERDSLAETRAALTANLNALTVDVATMRAERDAARRALAEAIYERDDALRKKREAQAERDALLDMARDISVYAATSARHGSERSMRDVLTMTASRARSFLLPKRPHKAGEAK